MDDCQNNESYEIFNFLKHKKKLKRSYKRNMFSKRQFFENKIR